MPLDVPAAAQGEVLAEAGIAFLFAPVFHPAMGHAGPVRRELRVPTVFNFLGPLTNPARPFAQVVGVSDERMLPLLAEVLARRGTRARLFRSSDALDELTTTTTSRVWAVSGGSVSEFTVDPDDYGLGGGTAEGLRGRDAAWNADVVRRLVAGEKGQVRDAVVLNAGAALAVHAAEAGWERDRLAAGIARAQESIDSGAAASLLDRWVAATSS